MQTMHTTLIGLVAWTLLVPAPAAGREPGGQQPGETRYEKATFAGGCFWCMEPPFDELPGVISTTSGYTGGRTKNPTYEEVSGGGTGHAEAVEILYDPAKITYAQLLDVFWKNIDPLTPDRQFCDVGPQYRSGIFYHNEEQKRLAEASKTAIEKSGRFARQIVTEIVAASAFYRAEEYHQDYYKKNPIRFNYYKLTCGRARRLQELWGRSDEFVKRAARRPGHDDRGCHGCGEPDREEYLLARRSRLVAREDGRQAVGRGSEVHIHDRSRQHPDP
jgi:peptide-methionine (S)-S-oxide reductase